MSACLCETPRPTNKRRQRASRRMLRDSCVRFSCQRVSAAFRCIPGGSPDSVGAAWDAPSAPTEPPGRIMGRFGSVPRASRDGLRRLLLARLGAQRRFGAPGLRFWLVWEGPRGLLGRLSRSIFARPGILRYALPSRVRQRSTNKTQKKKTWRFRFRPAFGCSSLPARVPRSNPQLASQRFTRCSKVSAPSYVINTYSSGSRSSSTCLLYTSPSPRDRG